MKFGKFPLMESEGAILAHTLRLPSKTLKKGSKLSRDDIDALSAAGVEEITSAILESDDVAEDEAAASIADFLQMENINCGTASTGRVNIFAAVDGLFRVDAASVDAFNAIDESITIATVLPFTRVKSGDLIATIKIIPYAVDQQHLDQLRAVEELQRTIITVEPFHPFRVTAIISCLPGDGEKRIAKRRSAIETRVERLGSVMNPIVECPHDIPAVSAAIGGLDPDDYDVLLLFGASAIVDRRDVIPGALVEAGGEIERMGMPVDPGNLLLLGAIGSKTAIGVPSCAASPITNGFDWVLERVFSDIQPSHADIAGMGVGGLLKEIPTRPHPRMKSTKPMENSMRTDAIVLAAGKSSRMGQNFKLLEEINGTPMIRLTCERILKSNAENITVVCGHRASDVQQALEGLPVQFVDNPDFADGIASSIGVGVQSLDKDVDAVLIALGDMPFIESDDINRLIATFEPDRGTSICIPTYEGRNGNPVLWGASFFSELPNLSGDIGAKVLLQLYADATTKVEVGNPSILVDIDTPDALASARNGSVDVPED